MSPNAEIEMSSSEIQGLTFARLWAYSADDKMVVLVIIYLFLENSLCNFM